jgi:hypothetical protein
MYGIPYQIHFIALSPFVNNIFRAVLLTLPCAFTGEGFVVMDSTEKFGPGLTAEGLAEA